MPTISTSLTVQKAILEPDNTRLSFTPNGVVSGLLYGDTIYRFFSTQDCTFYTSATNLGSATCVESAPMFSGLCEVYTTPSDVTGLTTATIHVVASGLTQAGVLHVTKITPA